MRRVYIYGKNTIPEDLQYLDAITDFDVQNKLKFINKKTEDPRATWEYLSNLDEYRRTRVKKLYLKDDSDKTVPKQVLNIVTRSFVTDPEQFLDKYNIDFEEF